MNAFRFPRLGSAVATAALAATVLPVSAETGTASAPVTQPYQLDKVTVLGQVDSAAGPGSVTRIGAADFAERELVSTRDLSAIAPNLTTFDANGDRTPRFSLRGLRENNFSYGESAVAMYIDDVPYADLYSRGVPLFGIDSAEFLRGPQGTLFGASRPGGVINLLTRLPGNTPAGYGTLRYGSYDAISAEAGVNGPVVKDNLFLGLSGLYGKREGFFHNLVTGQSPDSRETLAGRVQARWLPTDRVDVTFTAAAERFHDGGIVSRPIKAGGDLYDLKADQNGFNRVDSHTFSVRAAWTGEQVKVISISTRRDFRQSLQGDFDYAEYQPNPFLPPGVYVPIPVISGYASPKVGQWSQELRIESPDPKAALKWNAGGYWTEHVLRNDSGYVYGSAAQAAFSLPFPVTGLTDQTLAAQRDMNYALFGQLTYTVLEHLDVTAGLRWERDERNLDRTHLNPLAPSPFNSIAFKTSRNFDGFQPKVGLAYHLTPDATVWFSAAEGYQPGGFSPSQDNPATVNYAKSTSEHYELGLTGRLLDGALRASVSGFLIETKDYQVYRPVSFTDFRVLNADRARTWGAEAELRWEPVKGLEFAVAAGWTQAEFRNFSAPNPSGAGVEDLGGRTINFVPQFTLDASGTYRFPCGFFVGAGVTAIGEYWFDERNTAKQSPYALVRVRAGWEKGNFGVAVFAHNLTDTKYYANALDLGPSQGFVGTPGDPQVFGIELNGRF